MTWHPFGKEFNAHCRKIGQIVYDHLRPEGAWGMDVLSVGGRPLAVDLVRELDISCIFSQKLFFFILCSFSELRPTPRPFLQQAAPYRVQSWGRIAKGIPRPGQLLRTSQPDTAGCTQVWKKTDTKTFEIFRPSFVSQKTLSRLATSMSDDGRRRRASVFFHCEGVSAVSAPRCSAPRDVK